jgi:hypothetical protein
MYRQLPGSTRNEDLVELFGTTGQPFDSRRSYLTARGPRVQAWTVYKAETAVGTFLSKLFPSYLKRCGKCSQVPAIQSIGGDPSMYASMTAHSLTRLPHSSRRRPGSANATRQHVDGLLGTPFRPCMGLRVLTYVVVDSLYLAKMIRFDRVEPPTPFRGPARSLRVGPLHRHFDSSAS